MPHTDGFMNYTVAKQWWWIGRKQIDFTL